MKATDLMIGDLVNIYTFPNDNPLEKDLFPAKIVSILDGLPSERLHTAECIIPNKDGGYGIASRPVETCLPIAITPEILEKNGFVTSRTFNSVKRCDTDVYCIVYCIENGHLNIVTKTDDLCDLDDNHIYNIRYVHQLQHALRLCGIEKEIVM